MEYPVGDIALRYKELLMVEQIFWSMETILETWPIYHKTIQFIQGDVFCSFLTSILLKELQDRIQQHGWKSEWAQVCEELNDLEEFTVQTQVKILLSEAVPEPRLVRQYNQQRLIWGQLYVSRIHDKFLAPKQEEGSANKFLAFINH